MKKALVQAVRHILYGGYYILSVLWIPIIYFCSHTFGELRYLSGSDFQIWKRAMLSMLREYCRGAYNIRTRKIIYAFANSKIEVIRKREFSDTDGPIVVLCVKNDLQRIQMLVKHYRELGVKAFALLDNMSDDGTYEWLCEQPDIDLFRTAEPYQTMVKEAWINRLVSHYGFDRWYILTDSDELVCYIGMEEHPLPEVIRYAEQNGIKRFKALTLDMYTDGSLYAGSQDIKKDYCWMDTDSYYLKDLSLVGEKMEVYCGGPRWRVMGSDITLSKYPLVRFSEGTVSASAHYQFPFHEYRNTVVTMAIFHFKFIDKDLEEYKRRANLTAGFTRGGVHYQHYMDLFDNNRDLSFFYEGSVRFEDSYSLKRIPIIQEIPLNESKETSGGGSRWGKSNHTN